MRVFIHGLPRTGTNLMATALDAGGFPCWYDPAGDTELRALFQVDKLDYDPQPCGFKKAPNGPSYMPEGMCMRAAMCFPQPEWVSGYAAGEITHILMRRPAATSIASLQKMFPRMSRRAWNRTAAEWEADLDQWIVDIQNQLFLPGPLPLVIVDFDALIDTPLQVLQQFPWLPDPVAAAQIPNPDYRHVP